jgi:glycosyltransferase involved in cell wall biosynthesis
MKILRVTGIGYNSGGVETGIILTQPILEKHGHTVKILSSDSRPDLPHFNDYSYQSFSRLTKILYNFNPYSYLALKKVLHEYQPDIIHIHTLGEASPSLFSACKGYPTVVTIHGPEIFSKQLLLWCFPKEDFRHGNYQVSDLTFTGYIRYIFHRLTLDPLFSRGLKNVTTFVTLSHYMHDLMAKEGIASHYVPNGTVMLRYSPLAKEEITHQLTYVGRLETYKGVDHLIRALPKIIQKYPDVHLNIAGDGSYKKDLQELTDNLSLTDHVTFLGHIDSPNVEILYRNSSIVVMPSAYPEAFGKIGIEAMSVGRPVIASNVGGVGDWLIDGVTGFMVPPKDPSAIALSVMAIFSDPNLYLRMMVEGRKRAEEFDIHKHVELMEKIYLETIRLYQKTHSPS